MLCDKFILCILHLSSFLSISSIFSLSLSLSLALSLFTFSEQERVCEESASFDITSSDLALCIADVQSILEYMMKEENLPEEGKYT